MAGVSVEQDGYVRRAFERIRLAPGSVGQEGYVRRTSGRIHLGPSSAGLTAQTTDRDARYNIPLPFIWSPASMRHSHAGDHSPHLWQTPPPKKQPNINAPKYLVCNVARRHTISYV